MLAQANTFRDLLDKKYPTTLFAGVKNPQGKQVEFTYRKLLSKFSELLETDDKDTVLIAPCRLSGHYRADKNVQEINQLVFDIDDPKGLSFEELTHLISKYAGCVHTTHSHRADSPRYRVVLPLSRPVDVAQWIELRSQFLFFNPEIAEIIDPVCKEPSRGYYAWSAPPDRVAYANFFVSMGAPLKPEHFISSHRRPEIEKGANKFSELAKGGLESGSRNTSLASFLGSLINQGLSQQETLARCRDWNNTLRPPLDDEEVKKTHRSIWKIHLLKNSNSAESVSNANRPGPALRHFDLIAAVDLLNTTPKPRLYLVENFLARQIVAGLFAPGGVGKSSLTLNTAASVAAGRTLFGIFAVRAPGRVVILSGEDDREEIQRRLHRITGGFTSEEKALVGKNLFVIDLADAFELFTRKPSHGEIEITDVPAEIAKSIEDTVGKVDLVIVDPASRFRGGDENFALDTTRFIQSLQFLRDRLEATIWLVHHVNKGARVNGAGQNNPRGSSALIDGLRLGYELNVMTKEQVKKTYADVNIDTELLSLSSIKSNYGRPIDPITLQRNQDGTLTLFNGNPAELAKDRLLKAINSAALTKSQFRDRYAGVKGQFGLSEKALMASIWGLVNEGLLIAQDRGVMALTQAGLDRILPPTPTGDERVEF